MTEAPRRGWRCPSSQQIAAYLDQRLEEKDRERLEAHLADCDFCISLVGSLTRQQDGGDKTEPSPILLRQAIDSVPARRSAGWGWRWAVAPALAALVAASAVLLRSPEPPASRSAEVAAPAMETPAETPVPKESSPARRSARPTVRSLQPPPSELQVLDPQSGSVLAASDLVIRWKPAADVVYYEVRVADAEGDSVWRTESVASQARVPSAVDLSPGKYFVIVHAHLKDGRTLKSEAVPFRIKAHG